jgi:signal transduction histidine kinase/ligand-binding sensor domain-containing protein/DNA-binding response OmpR family regulator
MVDMNLSRFFLSFGMFSKVKYKLILFIIGLLNFPVIGYNQGNSTIPNGIFHHYSTDDGLSHSGVMCMLQDHIGFMWFGTWDGLNKFDGYKFTTYKSKPGGVNSLSHNRIDKIEEDNFGFLWVLTYDQKVHRFDPRSETFQPVPEILKSKGEDVNITNIIRTSNGNIWLLTNNSGCYRIITNNKDYSFFTYYYSNISKDSLRLSDNSIRFIYEDSWHNTWIGTRDGLNCISHSKYLVFQSKTLGNDITCSMEDKQVLWFGSKLGIIYNLDLKSGKNGILEIPGSPSVTCITPLTDHIFLIGTSANGLIEYNTVSNTFRAINSILSFNTEKIKVLSFYKDKFGLVWIETNRLGVFQYNPKTHSVKRFIQKTDKVSPFVYYGNYYTIFEDVNGYLWINLKGGGFCYYNREKDEVEYFYNEPGLPDRRFSNLVTFALSDSYGNLWLSTHSRGIEKVCFIKDQFHLHQLSPGSQVLSANEVRAIFEDRDEFLWVSTKEGKLYCYDKQRILKKIYSSESNSPGDISFNGMVYSIMQDHNGAIWLGTKGDGIIRAVPTGNPSQLKFKTEHFRHNENDHWSISNDWVYNIFEDSKNRIWIGTYGGGINLLKKDDNGCRFYNYMNSFHLYPHSYCDKIRYIQEDKHGYIWIGSTNGLIVFNPNSGKPESYRFNLYQKESGKKSSLANNDVHYILRSRAGDLWVSTFGGGLGKVVKAPDGAKAPEFQIYTSEDGLPIDIVLAMMEDKAGNLWLSTENGLSKFDPKAEEFTNFTELDGIKKLIFSEAACCESHHGDLFFGSYDGYYSFRPQYITKDNRSPRVMLVNFQLFNHDVLVGENNSPLKQSINLTHSITLAYNQSVFSIEYAGLDFRNSDKLEYAFKLDGFEKDWNYVRHQRKATYTNLPPGKYTFMVMCSTSGNFKESKYHEMEILILPPWWKTIWAYLGYFLLIAIISLIIWRIVVEIIRLKNKVIIEQQITDLKLRFFTNISHELRTPLTLIMGPLEDLMREEKGNDRSRYFMEIIDKNARRMLRNINNLLDFRKVQTGNMRLKIAEIEIISFVKDIFSGFDELAVSQHIDFRFSSNVKEVHAWIDPEKIDTVIFNLLSNAFKFTPEGRKIEVIVNNSILDGRLQILVTDRGVGIAEEDMPLLFERFAISHKSEGFNSKGTGIGLSLVKEIIKLHKGKVTVESKQGEGSTFIVELHSGNNIFSDTEVDIEVLADAHSSHSFNKEDIYNLNNLQPAKPAELKIKSATVLIVEDNMDLRIYIRNRLMEEYNVLEAKDGLEGIKMANSANPDLIISDIMMPGMNGIELVDKLRNDFNTSHIPIILLTAKSSVENIIEGIKFGADAYITKPFSMELLVTRVETLIEQRKKLMERFNNNMKVIDLAPDEIVVTAKDEQFLKDVIKIIEENMSNPDFHVEKIATSVGLGRTTFFKKLKGLTGFAPVEFMREMKLKRGYQLLETSEYTVSEISFMLGFSDAGYFTKCFKEKYSITPTDILKKKK